MKPFRDLSQRLGSLATFFLYGAAIVGGLIVALTAMMALYFLAIVVVVVAIVALIVAACVLAVKSVFRRNPAKKALRKYGL